jgi:hypothetical protein
VPEETANTLRGELVAALAANTPRVCDGLRAELARPSRLEPERPLQFEVDLWSWGISSCASEEPIITGDWLSEALTWNWFERAEAAGANFDAMISEELCPWFAACWQEVGGPARSGPAYLFFHDYHDQQYDLERRCWVPAEIAFPN